ncbi:MAG: SUF system Fe-S cluster assembly protein [Acidimicrobiia bacterium]
MTVDHAPADDREDTRARTIAALEGVYDPELGVDIVSLGLVYDVRVGPFGVDIDMTLTTVGCPVSESLPIEAESAVREALPDADVRVHIVWDPPWTPERMSDAALDTLGFRRR